MDEIRTLFLYCFFFQARIPLTKENESRKLESRENGRVAFFGSPRRRHRQHAFNLTFGRGSIFGSGAISLTTQIKRVGSLHPCLEPSIWPDPRAVIKAVELEMDIASNNVTRIEICFELECFVFCNFKRSLQLS